MQNSEYKVLRLAAAAKGPNSRYRPTTRRTSLLSNVLLVQASISVYSNLLTVKWC